MTLVFGIMFGVMGPEKVAEWLNMPGMEKILVRDPALYDRDISVHELYDQRVAVAGGKESVDLKISPSGKENRVSGKDPF